MHIAYPARNPEATMSTEGQPPAMNADFKERLVRHINSIKEEVRSSSEFPSDREVRAFYVVMLTVEGATLFGDLVAFSSVCLDFCKHKEKEAIAAN